MEVYLTEVVSRSARELDLNGTSLTFEKYEEIVINVKVLKTLIEEVIASKTFKPKEWIGKENSYMSLLQTQLKWVQRQAFEYLCFMRGKEMFDKERSIGIGEVSPRMKDAYTIGQERLNYLINLIQQVVDLINEY